jgi:biotin transporter BioY
MPEFLTPIGWALWFFILGAAPTAFVCHRYLNEKADNVVFASIFAGVCVAMICGLIAFVTVAEPVPYPACTEHTGREG